MLYNANSEQIEVSSCDQQQFYILIIINNAKYSGTTVYMCHPQPFWHSSLSLVFLSLLQILRILERSKAFQELSGDPLKES